MKRWTLSFFRCSADWKGQAHWNAIDSARKIGLRCDWSASNRSCAGRRTNWPDDQGTADVRADLWVVLRLRRMTCSDDGDANAACAIAADADTVRMEQQPQRMRKRKRKVERDGTAGAARSGEPPSWWWRRREMAEETRTRIGTREEAAGVESP